MTLTPSGATTDEAWIGGDLSRVQLKVATTWATQESIIIEHKSALHLRKSKWLILLQMARRACSREERYRHNCSDTIKPKHHVQISTNLMDELFSNHLQWHSSAIRYSTGHGLRLRLRLWKTIKEESLRVWKRRSNCWAAVYAVIFLTWREVLISDKGGQLEPTMPKDWRQQWAWENSLYNEEADAESTGYCTHHKQQQSQGWSCSDREIIAYASCRITLNARYRLGWFEDSPSKV